MYKRLNYKRTEVEGKRPVPLDRRVARTAGAVFIVSLCLYFAVLRFKGGRFNHNLGYFGSYRLSAHARTTDRSNLAYLLSKFQLYADNTASRRTRVYDRAGNVIGWDTPKWKFIRIDFRPALILLPAAIAMYYGFSKPKRNVIVNADAERCDAGKG
jgi:hypothetical protein